MATHRRFGSVRKRPSGRWQAEYWHDGRRISAGTFSSKADAYAHLSSVEADLRRGAWIDPRAGKVTLRVYANEWLKRRPDLAARTRELYRYVLDRHILPSLGEVPLSRLAPSSVRGWHAELATRHPATAAKAYRLLSSIMRTALMDGLILTTPCKVVRAGTERSAERPVATVAEIDALTEAMPEHLRLVVLLGAWCQLRRGEILGLRRKDIDPLRATISIEQTKAFSMDGSSFFKAPTSVASRRSVAMPHHIVKRVAEHLDAFVDGDPDALVFIGRQGVDLTRDALQGSWERARAAIGRPDLRLHDYADIFVMPTFWRTASSSVVETLKLSA